MLADVVADMKAQERQSKTGDAGVKDLGETGDIIWPRWDGGEESVREVGENVEAARASIAELNDVILPELSDELDTARTDLQQKLDAANARIDDIIVDGGGAGNFTTYSINEPSTAGTGDGDQWFRVVNGEVIGQWRWDGAAWVPVTLTDAIIAGIDLSKLVSNGNLSEVVANKIWADLFTANKITTQELAAGAVTAENLAAGAIRADNIEGGSFVGETFEGGSFTGGLFKTSEALPGQVQLSDDAYVTHFDGGGTYPGLRIVPIDTSQMNLPAAIGPSANGLTIFGGRNTSGGTSIVQCNPAGAFLRSFRPDGSIGGESRASPTESLMRTYGTDGVSRGVMETAPTYAQMVVRASNDTSRGLIYANTSTANLRVFNANNAMVGRIHVDANESYLFSAAGGANRYLSVDANGIWAKTNESGSWQHVSLVPEVRPFQYSALWNADQSPAHIMVQHLPGGKLCQAQIRIQNLTGSKLSLPHDDWVLLNYNPIPSDLRGGFTDYIEVTLPQLNARGRVEMNYSTGRIRVKSLEKDKDGKGVTIDWHNNNSIWFPMRWFSPN